MSPPISNRDIDTGSTGYTPSDKALAGARRNFRLGDKKRIIAEAVTPGASVSGLAWHYGINARVLKTRHADKYIEFINRIITLCSPLRQINI